ncbi:hypothetical protein [Brucella intermedia]|uniref:hypothetical protein n=1 Tax=Brucella intermedia TaxID=94625 RepID=UPI002361486D|nr:hypothetical protein [Brucella intermedia]
MKTVFKKVIVAMGFAAWAAPAIAGGSVCSVLDPTWRNQHSSTQNAIKTAIDEYSAAVAAENQLTANHILSSLRIMTAQRATVDNQIAATDLKANEANASAVSANMSRLAVAKAYETYGEAGQPPDSCVVVEKLSDFSQAIATADAAARAFATDDGIDTRPGGTPNVDESIKRRIALASAETLNVRKSLLDPKASEGTVKAFINNLTGLPLQKFALGEGGVSGQAGTAAQAQQNLVAARLEAYRSPALHSLGYIRSARTNGASSHTSASQGVKEHLDWIVARYGGGAEYERWAAAMVTKSEPGILKEIARIRQLAMSVRQMREESTERMTVIVGTMVAGESTQ